MRDAAGHRPRVLITRPLAQAGGLIDGVRKLGCRPIVLPCLTIETLPPPAPSAWSAALQGVAIFASRNAVEHAMRHERWPWPDTRVLAIGAATAEALALGSRSVALVPRPPYDTEALLGQLDDLPSGHGLRVALAQGVTIVTGEGGRPLLGEQLRRRGLSVRRLELYRRRVARTADDVVDTALTPMPEVISCTSDASLDALLEIVEAGPDGAVRRGRLLALPLVVNGDRCAAHARREGFIGPVLIARPAGDGGQLAALMRWLSGDVRPA